MITSTPAISRSEIESVLSKIRTISDNTQAIGKNFSSISPSGFENILSTAKNSLSAISSAQQESDALKTAYIKGDPSVPLSQVLVSSARSKVAFEGLIAVRKVFIEAYKEIMNMPV